MNKNGQTAKHGRSVTARARGLILKALDLTDDKSKGYKPVSELLAEACQKDVFRFMDVTAKYIVKDINTDADSSTDPNRLSDAELADIIANRARDRLTASQDVTEPPLKEVDTA